MIETKSKTIDGVKFEVTQFAGRRNFEILLRLAEIAGPAITALAVGAKGGNVMDADIDVDKVAQAVFRDMNRDGVFSLVRDMLASTHADSRNVAEDAEFDRVFTGPKIWRLPQVLAFVIETNYGNFSELAGSVSSLRAGSGADQSPAS